MDTLFRGMRRKGNNGNFARIIKNSIFHIKYLKAYNDPRAFSFRQKSLKSFDKTFRLFVINLFNGTYNDKATENKRGKSNVNQTAF